MQLFEHLIPHCKPVHDGSLDLGELDRADLKMLASFVQLRGVGECRDPAGNARALAMSAIANQSSAAMSPGISSASTQSKRGAIVSPTRLADVSLG